MHGSPVPKSPNAFEHEVAVSVLDKSCIAKANEVCCRDDAIRLIAYKYCCTTCIIPRRSHAQSTLHGRTRTKLIRDQSQTHTVTMVHAQVSKTWSLTATNPLSYGTTDTPKQCAMSASKLPTCRVISCRPTRVCAWSACTTQVSKPNLSLGVLPFVPLKTKSKRKRKTVGSRKT